MLVERLVRIWVVFVAVGNEDDECQCNCRVVGRLWRGAKICDMLQLLLVWYFLGLVAGDFDCMGVPYGCHKEAPILGHLAATSKSRPRSSRHFSEY